jgi:hypothetical protein
MKRCLRSEKIVVGGLGDYLRCGAWETHAHKEKAMKTKFNSVAERSEVAGGGLGGLFDPDFGDMYGETSPAWGALLGGGVAGGALLAAKAMRGHSPRVAKYAGLIALAAGGLPSVAAIFFHKTRRAGYLGLAMSAIIGVTETLRALFVEPNLGLYADDAIRGLGAGGIEILDAQADAIAEAMISGALGAGGIEILGQQTPAQAMGIGMYQPEAIGAHPLEVSGVQPFSGSIY